MYSKHWHSGLFFESLILILFQFSSRSPSFCDTSLPVLWSPTVPAIESGPCHENGWPCFLFGTFFVQKRLCLQFHQRENLHCCQYRPGRKETYTAATNSASHAAETISSSLQNLSRMLSDEPSFCLASHPAIVHCRTNQVYSICLLVEQYFEYPLLKNSERIYQFCCCSYCQSCKVNGAPAPLFPFGYLNRVLFALLSQRFPKRAHSINFVSQIFYCMFLQQMVKMFTFWLQDIYFSFPALETLSRFSFRFSSGLPLNLRIQSRIFLPCRYRDLND